MTWWECTIQEVLMGAKARKRSEPLGPLESMVSSDQTSFHKVPLLKDSITSSNSANVETEPLIRSFGGNILDPNHRGPRRCFGGGDSGVGFGSGNRVLQEAVLLSSVM